MAQKPTVVVTGAAGNLGLRLLPLLGGYNILALDKRDGSEVYNLESPGNATISPFHTLRVDPRLGTVELTSQKNKLVFQQGNEQARR